MDKPNIPNFSDFAQLTIQKYERYIPTAFDDSMSILQKMNMIIKYLNEIGRLSDHLIGEWAKLLEWVLGEGLDEAVKKKLDEMLQDGTLGELINEVLFAQLNADIRLKSGEIDIKNPPYPLAKCLCDGKEEGDKLEKIIRYAEQKNLKVVLTGIVTTSKEIEIKKHGFEMTGIGAGAGYGEMTYKDYQQISGIRVIGTPERTVVRTRSLYRGSASDPQDAPMNVVLNIQAEYVTLSNFSIVLGYEGDLLNPTNYGYNRDVGIFNGCRVHFKMEGIHVIGHFRKASIYQDVTRSSYTPQFKGKDGKEYDTGFVPNGADGLTLIDCFTYGGFWGLKIQGALPKAGFEGYSDPYYDQLLGNTVTDRRGNFGCSDVTIIESSIYGFNHASKRRYTDSTGNYLTDQGGGAMSIDGLAGNASGVIQGMRIISTRFMSWEPYRIKIDRANRVVMIGCHSEWGSGAMRKDGSLLGESDFYGGISTTDRSQNIDLIAFNARVRTQYIGANGLGDLMGASDTADVLRRSLNVLQGLTVQNDVLVGRAIMALNGDFDFRATEGKALRGRIGSVTKFLIDADNFNIYGNLLPNSDDAYQIGRKDRRFKTVHSKNGVVITTQDGTKQYLVRVDNNGNVITQLQP